MVDYRRGDELWEEWNGDELPQEFPESVVYYTNGHVDAYLDDFVLGGLASRIQRDGIVDTLGQAYRIVLDSSVTAQGYRSASEMDPVFLHFRDEDPQYDDEVIETTWVEIRLDER